MFRTIFESFSRSNSNGILELINGKSKESMLYKIIGTFLFLNNESNKFLICTVHYTLRLLPYNTTIELIPINPEIDHKYQFYFVNEEKRTKFFKEFRRSNEKFYKSTLVLPLDMPCEIMNVQTKETFKGNAEFKENMLFLRQSNETLLNEPEITNETNILSISDAKGSFNQADIFNSFIFIDSAKNLFKVTFQETDQLLCFFMDIISFKSTLLSKKKEINKMATPFPSPSISLRWNLKPLLKSDPIKLISTYDYPKMELTKISYPTVPDMASNELSVININNIKRNIVLSYGVPKKITFHASHVENDEITKNSFNQVIEEIRDDDDFIDFHFEQNDESLFSYIRLSDEKYFYSDNGKLLLFYFSLPCSVGIFNEKVKELGLNLINCNVQYSGQDVAEELNRLVTALPKNVSIKERKFFELCVFVASIFSHCCNIQSFFAHLNDLNLQDSKIKSCFPLTSSYNFETLIVLTERLILAKRLSSFFISILFDTEWKKMVYSDVGLLNSSIFIQNILSVILPLNEISFYGSFQIYTNYKSLVFFQTERIDLLIYHDINNIIQTIRCGHSIEKTYQHFGSLLSHISRFLQLGFRIKSHISAWPLFIYANDLEINDPEFNVFVLFIKETTQKIHVQSLMIPYCFLQGIKASISHLWILYLSLSAQKFKTHENGSPILMKEPVMIIAEALKDLSSLPIDITINDISQYIQVF